MRAPADDTADDILWRNTSTGSNYLWYMNGASRTGGTSVPGVSTAWSIAGVGDVSGDGLPDIVWQNLTSGARYVWYMDGGSRTGGGGLPSISVDWHIAAVRDFNEDGKPDLVWENASTGSRYLWYMDGNSVAQTAPIGTVATDWSIAEAADLNGDSHPDLIWENTVDGRRYVWFMNGASKTGGTGLPTVSTDWTIGGVGDMNGDGNPDLVWENRSNGKHYIWYMNGTSTAGGTSLPTIPTEWTVASIVDGDAAPALAITSTSPADARQGVSYSHTLSASGGSGSGYEWSLESGSLPTGVSLSTDGTLTGTPTSGPGQYSFTVGVSDSDDGTDSKSLTLLLCEAVLSLEVGEVATRTFPDECGLVIPDADQDFRVALMAAEDGNGASAVPDGLRIAATAGTPGVEYRLPPPERTPSRNLIGHQGLDPEIRDLARRTAALHHRLRQEERNRAPNVESPRPSVLTPFTGPQRAPGPARAPATNRQFYVMSPTAGERVPIDATLRDTSPHVYYYEHDHVETPATSQQISDLLDYYTNHGADVISDAFGGLGPSGTTNNFTDDSGTVLSLPANDLDQNGGRIIVLHVADSLMLSGAAAYVTACDRYPTLAHYNAGPFYCTDSNEAEITYIATPDSDFFLGTLVHEAKHISSHGYAVFSRGAFNPAWIEEGTAEIAKEKSSRDAAGIADGSEAGLADIYPTGTLNANTYGMGVVTSRARSFLKASPLSALVANPSPNPDNSTYYGASWLFHRFLADGYAGGDEDGFFEDMNTTGTGVAEIEATTGKSWETLVREFLVAVGVEGQSSAKAAYPLSYTSYDHAGIATGFPGTWPYTQGESAFTTGNLDFTTHYTSPNFYDFKGNGTTGLRLDALQADGDPVHAGDGVMLVITRIR